MEGGQQYYPRTVEQVFRDFKGRRAGLIKALTTDVEEFYQQCDPEKENLCLYGFPSEQWEVNLPAEEVPPELPEPALGINFARDGMQEKDWQSLVAVHSEAWLLAVAFYFGARFGFDRADRRRLFNMINDLPTIFEVVSGTGKKQSKEKSSMSNHSSTKSKSNSKFSKIEYSYPLYAPSDWWISHLYVKLGNLSKVIKKLKRHGVVLNRHPSIQDHNRKMRMKMVWKRRKVTSKEKHYVVLVVRTMHLTRSGSAVTYVRNGSMGNALRSLQLGPNISSITNAPPAATREHTPDCKVTRLTLNRELLTRSFSNLRKSLFEKLDKVIGIVSRLLRCPVLSRSLWFRSAFFYVGCRCSWLCRFRGVTTPLSITVCFI